MTADPDPIDPNYDDDFTLSGELDPWPTKSKLGSVLRRSGFHVYVGQYSVRLRDCNCFSFEHYGGDLCDPTIDFSGSNYNQMLDEVRRVSDALASADIRHRFEIYDGGDRFIHYLHHRWPLTSQMVAPVKWTPPG